MPRNVKRPSMMRTRVALEFWRKVRARHLVRIGGLPLYPWPMQFAPRFVFAASHSRWSVRREAQQTERFAVGRRRPERWHGLSAMRSAGPRGMAFRRAASVASSAARTAAAPRGDRRIARKGKRIEAATRPAARAIRRSRSGAQALAGIRGERVRGLSDAHARVVHADRRLAASHEAALRGTPRSAGKTGATGVEIGAQRMASTMYRGVVPSSRMRALQVVVRAARAVRALRRDDVAIAARRSRMSVKRSVEIVKSSFRSVVPGIVQSSELQSRKLQLPDRRTRISHAAARGASRDNTIGSNNVHRSRHTIREQAPEAMRTNHDFHAPRVADAPASRTRRALFTPRSMTAWPSRSSHLPQRTDGRTHRTIRRGTQGRQRLSIRPAPRPSLRGNRIVRATKSPRVPHPARQVLLLGAQPDKLHPQRTVAARQVHVSPNSPRVALSNASEQRDTSGNNESAVIAARRMLMPLVQEVLSSGGTVNRLTSAVMERIGRRDGTEQYRKTGGR